MPTFQGAEAGYKHDLEVIAKRIKKFVTTTATVNSLIANPVDTYNLYNRLVNLGTLKLTEDGTYIGSGAPSLASVPDGGVAGNIYFRTDTPTVGSQRIYICTVGTGNGTLGTWVDVFALSSPLITTVPTAAAAANAGTSPPAPVVSANSNDTRGQITFGTGTTPAAGTMVTVTFGTAYTVAPFVSLTPTNIGTAPVQPYVASVSTTNFVIGFAQIPSASQANTTFAVEYRVN